MRTPASREFDREHDVEKFSGDEPDAAMKFLDHDMSGQDYAEAKYGVIGAALHRGTDPIITAANLDVEATKLHRFITIAEGSKSGDAAWNNADFWTPEYQNAFRLHWKRQLLQWQKHHSSGRYKAWLQDFKAEDFSRIRDLAMREFGGGRISRAEQCPVFLDGQAELLKDAAEGTLVDDDTNIHAQSLHVISQLARSILPLQVDEEEHGSVIHLFCR